MFKKEMSFTGITALMFWYWNILQGVEKMLQKPDDP